MHGAMKGEHISRRSVRWNAQDREGAETLEGLFHPSLLRKSNVADEARWELIDTLGRRWVR
jgi:hypothetical protein